MSITTSPRLGQIRRRLFGISPEETSIARRGFTVSDPTVQKRLETIGQAFVQGYHAALLHPQPTILDAALNKSDPELCGFAYEGAGMGLALLDLLAPWPSRYLLHFLHGPGQPHAYIIQIGVGWALARLHRPVEGWLWRLDPVTSWLLLDGYGFHETYFGWQRVLGDQVIPKQLTGYARRGFDQGVGRALWFVKGANVDRMTAAIGALSATRHNDIWSGVGLASAYAGGVSCSVLTDLREAAGPEYFAPLAQGVVFAAKTRLHAGNPAPHTEMACQEICGLSLSEAATLFDHAGQDLPTKLSSARDHGFSLSGKKAENTMISSQPQYSKLAPAFEIWRQRIQHHFQEVRQEVAA